ncbi:MAG: sulfotransferase [Sneathiella sp.]
MSRAMKRKQELRLKKKQKKLHLTTASTGLSAELLAKLQKVIQLANQAIEAQDYSKSKGFCLLALSIYPKCADPYHLLGGIALQDGQYTEALSHFEKALAISPDSPVTLNNYSIALKFSDRHEEALIALNKCLRLKPDYFEALSNKGSALSILGQVENSFSMYRKALKVNPNFGKAYLNIATAHKFTEGDDWCEVYEKAEKNLDTLAEIDRMNLHFALGKYHEDLERYEAGFSHYIKANKFKRNTFDYSVANDEKMMAKIQDVFDVEGAWVKRTEVGNQSNLPIFILGMPRSGTTLIEQILASHHKVHGAGELKAIKAAVDGLSVNSGGFFPTDQNALPKFDKKIRKRGDAFVEELRRHNKKAAHVTDKMPQNFQYLGLIHVLMPNAKIIRCRRNPVDTCLSNFRILFGDKMDYTYDLEEIGRYYLAYDRMVKHWGAVLSGRHERYSDLLKPLLDALEPAL